jgi:hypothetical protein
MYERCWSLVIDRGNQEAYGTNSVRSKLRTGNFFFPLERQLTVLHRSQTCVLPPLSTECKVLRIKSRLFSTDPALIEAGEAVRKDKSSVRIGLLHQLLCEFERLDHARRGCRKMMAVVD